MKKTSLIFFIGLISTDFSLSSDKVPLPSREPQSLVLYEKTEEVQDPRLKSFDAFAAFIIKEGFSQSRIPDFLIEAGINPDPSSISTESIQRLHLFSSSHRIMEVQGKEERYLENTWIKSIEDFSRLRISGSQPHLLEDAPEARAKREALALQDSPTELTSKPETKLMLREKLDYVRVLPRSTFERDKKHYLDFLKAFDQGEVFVWAQEKFLNFENIEKILRKGVRFITLTQSSEKKEALMVEYKGFDLEFSEAQHSKWTGTYIELQKHRVRKNKVSE